MDYLHEGTLDIQSKMENLDILIPKLNHCSGLWGAFSTLPSSIRSRQIWEIENEFYNLQTTDEVRTTLVGVTGLHNALTMLRSGNPTGVDT